MPNPPGAHSVSGRRKPLGWLPWLALLLLALAIAVVIIVVANVNDDDKNGAAATTATIAPTVVSYAA